MVNQAGPARRPSRWSLVMRGGGSCLRERGFADCDGFRPIAANVRSSSATICSASAELDSPRAAVFLGAFEAFASRMTEMDAEKGSAAQVKVSATEN